LYEKFSTYPYIGDTNLGKENPREEYVEYVRPQNDLSGSPFRPEAFAEFKEALQAMSLSADDVDGIRKVCSDFLIAVVFFNRF
jgi:hypothetical protein